MMGTMPADAAAHYRTLLSGAPRVGALPERSSSLTPSLIPWCATLFSRTAIVVATLIAVGLGAAGCGRKSAPKPPELFAPAAVEALSAVGEVDAIRLTWIAPSQKANGDALDDLDHFVVERAEIVKGEAPDFDDIGEVTVPLSDRPAPEEGRSKRGMLGVKKDKPQAPAKGYQFRDTDVKVGERYAYRVRPENDRGVEGAYDAILRVTFTGLGSSVEALPADVARTEGGLGQ